jgi:hypothetical protein
MLRLPITVLLALALTTTTAPASAQEAKGMPAPGENPDDREPVTWAEFEPGKGFRVANTSLGDLWISGYAVARWLDQLPSPQTYDTHLGVPTEVLTRNDIHIHRMLLFFRGWLFRRSFEYNLTMWTVNSADILAFIGTLAYKFHRAFNLAARLASVLAWP